MTIKTTDSEITETKKIEQPKIEKEESSSLSVAQTPDASLEIKEDINWKKFREEREKERKAFSEEKRKREETEKQAAALRAALEAVTNKPSAPSQNQYQDYSYQIEETEEQRIQKAVSKAIAEAERRREEQQLRKEQEEMPYKLSQAYSNFNDVCSDENLDYLQYHYPEVYHTFKAAPDSFDKWSNVYKAIKRFIPNSDNRRDEKRLENNMKKPQSMSVPGVTPTGDSAPIRLDEKKRADNWARMQRAIKGMAS